MEMKEIAALNERLRDHILSLAKAESWKRNDELIAESIAAFEGEPYLGAIKNVYIVGHGTSFATASNAESLIAHIAKVHARALHAYQLREYPEEFILEPEQTLVIGITCGGNTVSVKLALKESRRLGAHTMLISNDGDASCAEFADVRIKTACNVAHAADGQPHSVTHRTPPAAAYGVAPLLAAKPGAADGQQADCWREKFAAVRGKMECLPRLFDEMEKIATWFKDSGAENLVVLGTGPNMGTMVEGALKICEMAWKFGAGEELEDFAHGRFREMDGKIPLFIITPDEKTREKVLDLLAGCNISGTPTVLFTGSVTPAMEKLATRIVRMPEVEDEYLTPFLYVFPLWFFGYHVRKMENGLVGEKRFGLFAKDIDFKAHFNEAGEWIG
ncbi:MAG: SIS domain-containing protein [Clostridium sp.]|nr:SIS domain-containing protein [Clostridium sp.]